MTITVLAVRQMIGDWPATLRLGGLVAAGALAYAGTLASLWPDIVRDSLSMLRDRTPDPECIRDEAKAAP
jgi:hypothetical protein